jgi:hypothetical protein
MSKFVLIMLCCVLTFFSNTRQLTKQINLEMGNEGSQLGGEAKKDEMEFLAAVQEGNIEKVMALIQNRPDVIHAHTRDHQSAWHVAAHLGHDKVRLLVVGCGKDGTFF